MNQVRNVSAISGAIMGATVGLVGGVVGMGAAGLVGAVLGALGGLAMERDLERTDDSGGEAIALDPPCEDCVTTRAAGGAYWCARHSRHRPHAHVFSELPPSFGVGWMLVRP